VRSPLISEKSCFLFPVWMLGQAPWVDGSAGLTAFFLGASLCSVTGGVAIAESGEKRGSPVPVWLTRFYLKSLTVFLLSLHYFFVLLLTSFWGGLVATLSLPQHCSSPQLSKCRGRSKPGQHSQTRLPMARSSLCPVRPSSSLQGGGSLYCSGPRSPLDLPSSQRPHLLFLATSQPSVHSHFHVVHLKSLLLSTSPTAPGSGLPCSPVYLWGLAKSRCSVNSG
jgi:hypothetical protein